MATLFIVACRRLGLASRFVSGYLVSSAAVAVHRHPEAIPPVSGTFYGPIEPNPKMTVKVEVAHL